jgi:hypothetical protein
MKRPGGKERVDGLEAAATPRPGTGLGGPRSSHELETVRDKPVWFSNMGATSSW